ncbi:hypothetical protein FRACYDRAFT_249443 [Fragilariopsis cylindrus CCMP1102]|uniref:Uncharacterized protein n=1 Tax=Fragilariopsis cylindrus CCMP1102 TaxID=635003 RepID=A0A1E7ERJ6_9STRA|nr:hypothetical protein FRACYDRAFT_249443 [Fragilariopsis cylindrus CCMP1102]|eukprot:OEU08551.1 hypothetical protein FRACYDRAFT_249443 [Fragilariopsis cylindrus CCMP1102]
MSDLTADIEKRMTVDLEKQTSNQNLKPKRRSKAAEKADAHNDADPNNDDSFSNGGVDGIYQMTSLVGDRDANGHGSKSSSSSDVQFPLLLVMISSMILLIAVTTWEGVITSNYDYCISIPSVSLITSSIGIALTLFREDIYYDYGIGKYLPYFLGLWNFIGASYMTFNSPFITTGNGYFACWTTVATSAMTMGVTGTTFKNSIKGIGSLMGVFGSSIVMILALYEYIFVNMIKFITLSLFTILWLVLACLVTFHGPFVTTGNGYFSSWAGFVCISFTAFQAKQDIGDIGVNNINYVTDTVTETVTGFYKKSRSSKSSDNGNSNSMNDSSSSMFSSGGESTSLSKTIT